MIETDFMYLVHFKNPEGSTVMTFNKTQSDITSI